MKSRSCVTVAAFTLSVIVGSNTVRAEGMTARRRPLILLDVPVAVPLNPPQRGWFGVGAMPALTAVVPAKPWLLLGLRLRGGFLSEGSVHSDPTLQYPKTGGLGALLVTVRLRPFASKDQPLAAGLWLDAGAGVGITGRLLRPTLDAGLGWSFPIARFALGPTVRYVQVVETLNALNRTDAKILLVGLEGAFGDRSAPLSPPPTPPPAPPSTDKRAVGDRDGDGIADDVDRCPDEPEDRDGFEDEDGCPDLDNDKDGIPDAKDACPNEPETLNGYKDDDGCPDDAPIEVKEDRIYLKELLLFDTNRARVRTAGWPALAAVLELWRQHAEWDHLVVDGHADRHGPDRFNVWLSQVRAERVRKKLVQMGFPEDRLVLRAFGNSQLRVPARTTEADRENRRVEFIIVRKGEAPAEVAGALSTASSLEPPRHLSHLEVKP